MANNIDNNVAREKFPSTFTLLLIVISTALAVRLVNFIQLKDSAVLHTYLWADSDMGFFLRWSRDIRAGNVIGDPRPTPWHVPYQRVTRQAHALNGDPRPWTEEIGLKILAEWTGGKRFIQEPLYPFLLAGVFDLFGCGAWPVLVLQSIQGIGITAILFSIGLIVFGRWTGFVAGLLTALNFPLLLYESTLLRQTLLTFLTFLTALFIMLACKHPRLNRWWILSGLSGGLSLSAFSGILPALVGFVAWLIWQARKNGLDYARPMFLMATAFLIVLAPIVVRNVLVGIAPWSLSGMATANYVATNCADCFPWGGYTISSFLPEILNRHGNSLIPAAMDAIRTHDGWSAWLGFMGRRILGVLNTTEYPNNVSLAYYMLHTGLVSRIGIGFGLVMPCSLAGLMLLKKKHGLIAPLLFVASIFVFICVVFLNITRFRVSLTLALVPIAAFGIVRICELLRNSRYRQALPAIFMAALGVFVAYLPWAPDRPVIKDTYFIVANEIAESFIAKRLEANDIKGAERVLNTHLNTEPEELREYAKASVDMDISIEAARLAGAFINLHQGGARIRNAQGDSVGAARFKHEAGRLQEMATKYENLIRWHHEQLGKNTHPVRR